MSTREMTRIEQLFMNGANAQRNGANSLNATNGGAATPQYIIVCPEFFSSEIEGFEEISSPCLGIDVGSARLATYDSSGELSGDGRIVTLDPIVRMKYGSWAPIIEQYMYEGKKLEKISLKRFISINGTKVIIQELNYENCLIKSYVQEDDLITFSYCFVILEDVDISYDHEGKKIGNTATIFNTSTLKVAPGGS